MLLCFSGSWGQRKHAPETHVCFWVLGSAVSGDFCIYKKKKKKARRQPDKYRKKQGRGEECRRIQRLCEEDRLLSRMIKCSRCIYSTPPSYIVGRGWEQNANVSKNGCQISSLLSGNMFIRTISFSSAKILSLPTFNNQPGAQAGGMNHVINVLSSTQIDVLI